MSGLSMFLLKDYGWYLASGAVVVYLTYRAWTGVDPEQRRSEQTKRRERERRKREQQFTPNQEGKSSPRRRRQDARGRNNNIRRQQGGYQSFASSSSSSSYNGEYSNPQQASKEAKALLSSLVARMSGGGGPAFVPDSLQTALEIALVQNRALFVYLHAPAADASAGFSEEILGSNGVAQYLTANFVCWAGSLRDQGMAEGYLLAKEMGEEKLSESLVAVIGVVSSPDKNKNRGHKASSSSHSVVKVVAKAQALFRNSSLFLQWALLAQDNWNTIVEKRKSESARRMIVSEQNSEYEQALLQDEQKLSQEHEEEQRRLDAVRAAAEENRLEKAEEKRRIDLRDSLPKEPSVGAKGVVVANIRFLFPDGTTRVSRRFDVDQAAKVMFQFIESHLIRDREDEKLLPMDRLRLVTRFPRKVLPRLPNATLREIGVSRDTVLVVEEIFDN
mmetsp:Transcript_32596/g.52807  ORF Transcript_32596/g.52807 Transcript_32596/m.52807 type:complete len:446 (+) Transcript_32596:67-1404(+)